MDLGKFVLIYLFFISIQLFFCFFFKYTLNCFNVTVCTLEMIINICYSFGMVFQNTNNLPFSLPQSFTIWTFLLNYIYSDAYIVTSRLSPTWFTGALSQSNQFNFHTNLFISCEDIDPRSDLYITFILYRSVPLQTISDVWGIYCSSFCMKSPSLFLPVIQSKPLWKSDLLPLGEVRTNTIKTFEGNE